jgi:hypothetical protein
MPIRPETDSIIEFLDGVAKLDPAFVGRLLAARVPCNDAIATHPTIQSSHPGKHLGDVTTPPDTYVCGFLGLLNGYCGTFDDGPGRGWGPITAILEEDGTVSGFCRTDNTGNSGPE